MGGEMKDLILASIMSLTLMAVFYTIEINNITSQPDQRYVDEYLEYLGKQPNVYETTGKVA